ncbi:hypothetical protein [Streptomyces sp. NBC_00576]|uniref:hypothetical protein n=1 Tax=Streptomyces sp. NBC_00576 TaxID=2903665 RepID=UPI002E80D9D8|nr:hypothetical protein [Streptomyces sp. NBC_00576]WUB68766.1 hypothetical protein OG734_00875 [Streptomyces sp. NBC_00576]
MRAAVMSGVEPGSTSETQSGVPSGADRNWMLPPNALCFWLKHRSFASALTLAQDFVQVRGLVGEDVDAFV